MLAKMLLLEALTHHVYGWPLPIHAASSRFPLFLQLVQNNHYLICMQPFCNFDWAQLISIQWVAWVHCTARCYVSTRWLKCTLQLSFA